MAKEVKRYLGEAEVEADPDYFSELYKKADFSKKRSAAEHRDEAQVHDDLAELMHNIGEPRAAKSHQAMSGLHKMHARKIDRENPPPRNSPETMRSEQPPKKKKKRWFGEASEDNAATNFRRTHGYAHVTNADAMKRKAELPEIEAAIEWNQSMAKKHRQLADYHKSVGETNRHRHHEAEYTGHMRDIDILQRRAMAHPDRTSNSQEYDLKESTKTYNSGDRILVESRGAGSVINNRNGYITISFDSGAILTYDVKTL